MVLVVLLVAVPIVLLALLVASFVITRQAVTNAGGSLERDLPVGEAVLARAAANCLDGAKRGMGMLVVTERSLHFRGARGADTLTVDRHDIVRAEAQESGPRPVLAVEWRGGAGTWRVADPAALAAELSPR